MGSLAFLLTLPGEWLAALLFDVAPDAGSDTHAGLFVALGVACWLVLLLALWLAWHLARRSGNAAALARRTSGTLTELLARAAARWRDWNWRDAFGVGWRAQAAHLAIYAAVPLLWVATRWVFLVATSPLWVLGPGSGPMPIDAALDHLREPACWTFVTICALPNAPVTGAGWIAKLSWLLLAAAWIVPGWRRRRLRSAPSRPAPPPGSPAG